VEESSSKPKIPSSYRQLLNLDPQDIIAFFDVKSGRVHRVRSNEQRRPSVDVGAPHPPITANDRVLQGRSSREMASRIIKIRRGVDDPLLDDKAAREKYKYERSGFGMTERERRAALDLP